ncbi:MAG: hypothetical protein U9R01_08375, partial [candidate division WOR-3 bacterium]|nr:hypothetical protein [candidate division WOR-3 bacterium]
MFLGLKDGNKPKEWVGLEPFDEYHLTPYSVVFHKSDDERAIEVTYEFCKGEPAMVAKIEITNNSTESKFFEVYTHLETSLRTCHTYALKEKAWTEFDGTGSTIYTNFDDSETGNAQIFVANAGELPRSFTTNGEPIGLPGTEENWWINKTTDLPGEIVDRASPKRPVAAFIYMKNLSPKQKMTIIQIIGSCQLDEGRDIVRYLLGNYEKEINLYEQSVLTKVYRKGLMETGDSSIDHSGCWAKAILATNTHYLDGEFVPMPCPAEYNFFFTHDALLTDLVAVNFDIARVKKDLEYIIRHANPDGIIPHAYYWKDDCYVTEFAGPDNWNHFWFVL